MATQEVVVEGKSDLSRDNLTSLVSEMGDNLTRLSA